MAPEHGDQPLTLRQWDRLETQILGVMKALQTEAKQQSDTLAHLVSELENRLNASEARIKALELERDGRVRS